MQHSDNNVELIFVTVLILNATFSGQGPQMRSFTIDIQVGKL